MKTILADEHAKLGAKIIDFSGWLMPVSYKGIIAEHLAVRQKAGIFDVSHMGRISIQGPEAEQFLDFLSTNAIAQKKDNTATYTVFCNEEGGCIDDVIVYRFSAQNYFIVANASNREKDLAHLKKYASSFKVEIQPLFHEEGILAVQGPAVAPILTPLFPEAADLKPMHFSNVQYKGHALILSRTGYTGAGGFELYAKNPLILQLWKELIEKGIEPCGLGARDTLRLEMGYALYGHEINEDIAPTESVSAWTVKWDRDFLGKKALEKLENSLTKRAEYGILLQGNGIAREGYPVFKNDVPIGKITSGTHSPTLNKAIAIALVKGKLQIGESVDVQIRQNLCQATVVPLPFYKKEKN